MITPHPALGPAGKAGAPPPPTLADDAPGPPAGPPHPPFPAPLAVLCEKCPPLSAVTADCEAGRTPSPDAEKALLATVGFLPGGGDMLHRLMARLPDYSAQLVDYKLSRLSGTPLGCRRIHRLLDYAGPECRFPESAGYPHPLLHLNIPARPKAARDADLAAALDRLKLAIFGVERFL